MFSAHLYHRLCSWQITWDWPTEKPVQMVTLRCKGIYNIARDNYIHTTLHERAGVNDKLWLRTNSDVCVTWLYYCYVYLSQWNKIVISWKATSLLLIFRENCLRHNLMLTGNCSSAAMRREGHPAGEKSGSDNLPPPYLRYCCGRRMVRLYYLFAIR